VGEEIYRFSFSISKKMIRNYGLNFYLKYVLMLMDAVWHRNVKNILSEK